MTPANTATLMLAVALAICVRHSESVNPIFLTGKICTKRLPSVDFADSNFTEVYSRKDFEVNVKGFRTSSFMQGEPTDTEGPLGLAVTVKSNGSFDIMTGIALSGAGDPVGQFLTLNATSHIRNCVDQPLQQYSLLSQSLSCDSSSENSEDASRISHMTYVKKDRKVSSVMIFIWRPKTAFSDSSDEYFRFHFVAIDTQEKRFWSGIQSPILKRSVSYFNHSSDYPSLKNMALTQQEIHCVPLSATAYEVHHGVSKGRSIGVLRHGLYARIINEPLDNFTVDDNAVSHAYKACSITHGCIGETLDCVRQKNCKSLITHKRIDVPNKRNDLIQLQLFTALSPVRLQQGYTAVGFSFDRQMGEDVAIQCLITSNGTGQVHFSWNLPLPEKNNVRIDQLQCTSSSYVLSQCSVGLAGNRIGCQLHLLDNFIFRERRFDFSYESYFVLGAAGRRLGASNILKHDFYFVSDVKKSLAIIKDLPQAYLYTKIHAVLMMFVWMVFVSNAIFFSRYFKETWAHKLFLGRRIYFAIHVTFNLIGFFVMIVSNVYILYVTFVKRRRWHEADVVQFHMKAGGTACLLYLVQVSSGWVNPIDEVSRRLFGIGHWVVGTVAGILSLVTLLHSPQLPQTGTPCLLGHIVLLWFAWTVAFHIIMAFHFRWLDTILGRVSKRGFSPLPMMNVTHDSAPGTRKRIAIWAGYFVGTLFITTGLSVYLFYNDADCNCDKNLCYF